MPSPPLPDLTIDRLISHFHSLTLHREDGPTETQIRHALDILYSASLLKEEGRSVRARVIIAAPDDFMLSEGPPDGVHPIRFMAPHPFTANEIKRLSPAASFFHTVVAIWPDRDRGFRIWGILNTGTRWLNQVAGGRKTSDKEVTQPMIHVREPGWLLFYQGYQFLAEWRGTEFHGPRLDVFQIRLLDHGFAHFRLKMVEELSKDCLPTNLDLETYAELSHLISLQFVKRVVNLIRTSGHGGSMVMLPFSNQEAETATSWIDCKYHAEPNGASLRFRHLLESIIRRVGHLSPPDASLDDAWNIFRNSHDEELDLLEEAFFELARLFSDLMQVDGALVVDQRMSIVGFGGEIRVDRNVLQVFQAFDLDGKKLIPWNVQNDGTRHRSVYRLCSVEPKVVGFVISQDSQVRLIANVDGAVVFWAHTMI